MPGLNYKVSTVWNGFPAIDDTHFYKTSLRFIDRAIFHYRSLGLVGVRQDMSHFVLLGLHVVVTAFMRWSDNRDLFHDI